MGRELLLTYLCLFVFGIHYNTYTNVMFRWESSSHTSRLAYSSRHASSTSFECPFDTSNAVALSYGTSDVPCVSAQSLIAI